MDAGNRTGLVAALQRALSMRHWPTLIIVGLLVLPVLAGVIVSILPAFGYLPALGGDGFSLEPWRQLLQVPGLSSSIQISFMAALVTPLVAIVLVFLFLASAANTRLDRWVRRLISPLLAIPHAAAAFGLAFLIAPAGLLSRLISPGLTGWNRPPDLLLVNDPSGISLMTGLVVKEIPFLLLMALAALPQINPTSRVRLGRSLGYSPAVAWLKVVAPALYPLIRLPVFAVIVFASATVDVAIILGPTLPPTLSVRLLGWFNDPDLSFRFLAAAAALLQLLVSVGAVACWLLLEKVVSRLWKNWIVDGHRRRLEVPARLLGRTGMPLVLVVVCGAVLSLIMYSLAGSWRYPDSVPSSLGLQHWAGASLEMALPIQNTIVVSVLATFIAIVLVLLVLEMEIRQQHRSSIALWLLYVPLLVPQVVFLFGLVVITEMLGWRPAVSTVIFGHLLFVVPYVFLSLSEPYRRLDPRWTQLAATLGAGQFRTFLTVRLRLLLAPCLTACALGLAVSIGLFLPTQLLGGGRVATVTTEAVSLATGGNRNITSVWALVQAILPLLGFAMALAIPKLLWRHRQGMREL